jgi:NAD(P)-dependent dehydrogenase (short-subunit alcohol dehydrogenase family)
LAEKFVYLFNRRWFIKLEGKVAVITGAATGIGRATAKLFAKEGAKVVVADIKDKEAHETVKMIKEAGGEAIFNHINVAVVAELEKMIKAAVETYCRLDIFYHNAGVAGPGYLELTTEENYDLAMAINLKAGFFGAKYAVPEIKKVGGGSILFTSSSSGVHPSPAGSPSYSVAKAGLIMLTRALALYLAKDNIRVNCICPGPITTTPLWPDFVSRNPGIDPKELTKAVIEQTVPLKRAGTPEEIAEAALFLVTPKNSYVTGIALPVDGGSAAR